MDNSEFMLIFAIPNDMLMKTYLYFATEENCFETEKFTTENPLADIKSFLADSYIQVQEAETAAYQAMCDFNKNGYALIEMEDGQGYWIIVGIAKFGKCHEITSVIKDNRAEAIALAY